MLSINGYTTNTVICNGHPTTGIYNGTVVWGVKPWITYTASGTLSASSTVFGITNSNSTSQSFYYKVNSISPSISGSWLNSKGILNPPMGTYFGSGSKLYVKVNFSASSNRDSRKIYADNLHNATTASASPYGYLGRGFTAILNSGNYPNRSASANINLSGVYANGYNYSANSGFSTIYSIGPTANSTTAKCSITGSTWSAVFNIQG
jgi:hypothetical protein